MKIDIDHSQKKLLDTLQEDFNVFKPKAEKVVSMIVEAQIGEVDRTKSEIAEYIMNNFSDAEILFMATNHMSDIAEKHLRTAALKSMLGKLVDSDGAPDEDDFETSVNKLLGSPDLGEDEEIG